MVRRKLIAPSIVTFVAAFTTMALAVAAEPASVVGTWQLNLSKSVFTSGPTPKSQIRTYTQSGPSITVVIKTVGADGKESATQTTYEFDGKDHPVTGSADYDTIVAKQVNPRSATFTLKKAGKTVGTTTRTISKDGKTLTSKSSVHTASGGESDSVMVFDRQ